MISRVSWNTTVLIAAQIIEKAVNFFLIILLVRYLSEEGFGRYGFVSSYVVLFNVFIGLGFSSLCIREISQKPEQAPHILTASLVPMLFASVVTFGVVRWSILWSKPGATEVILSVQLAAIALILNNLANIFGTIPRAQERMIYAALPRLAKQFTVFLLCLLLLPTGLGLAGVFQIMIFGGLIELGLQVYFSSILMGVAPARKFDPRLSWKVLKDSFPLALTSIFVIIYYKIDSVMLSYMQNDRQVALYTAAYNLAFAFLFIGTSFHQATYPVFSKLFVESHENLYKAYRFSIKYLIILGLPISVGMMLLAPQIIPLVYGVRYISSVGALQILMVPFFFMFLNGFTGNMLITGGNQKELARVIGIGTILNVGLNLVIIPRYGFIGAAATTMITEIYATLYTLILLRHFHGITLRIDEIIRPLLGCAVMAAFMVAFSHIPLHEIVPMAAAAYFLSLYVCGAIRNEDLKLLRGLLGGGFSK